MSNNACAERHLESFKKIPMVSQSLGWQRCNTLPKIFILFSILCMSVLSLTRQAYREHVFSNNFYNAFPAVHWIIYLQPTFLMSVSPIIKCKFLVSLIIFLSLSLPISILFRLISRTSSAIYHIFDSWEEVRCFFLVLHKFPLYPKAVSNFVFKEKAKLSEILYPKFTRMLRLKRTKLLQKLRLLGFFPVYYRHIKENHVGSSRICWII